VLLVFLDFYTSQTCDQKRFTTLAMTTATLFKP